ncbi:FAD-linked sulfhydryl oxidase ALR [Teratosphaeria destructans]|uniref:Sulfhydryl oxidase n=1 Tax=Teratosphaeria destructans TaxID=418781 RepID=A0A9W7T3E0_9PEZI|nr:FAD-linked sulfhydryl oxidase ALR [Teratosphaeria destructans]
MPLTEFEFPILQTFFCNVEKRTGLPAQPLEATEEQVDRAREMEKLGQAQAQEGRREEDEQRPKGIPKGVVLGADGKPCLPLLHLLRLLGRHDQATDIHVSHHRDHRPARRRDILPPTTPRLPPDVERLGRSTWTLLHTMTANYPTHPTPTQQSETKQFLTLFGKMYPCWSCAEDFRTWMREQGNEPRVSSREEFGRWMCEAHNAVNGKLGKGLFDCGRWEERWRTGWRDGRCR